MRARSLYVLLRFPRAYTKARKRHRPGERARCRRSEIARDCAPQLGGVWTKGGGFGASRSSVRSHSYVVAVLIAFLNPDRHSPHGSGAGCARQLGNKWSSVGCNAPNRREQLSHRRHECDFAGLSPRNQTLIVSSQPRIESYGSQNWHPKRLPQPSVPQTDDGGSRESFLPGLPQPGSYTNVTR